MTEPRIDEVAGTFEIHRAEVAEFCKYLTTLGIHCDPGVSNTGANWSEAPEGIPVSEHLFEEFRCQSIFSRIMMN